MLICTPVQGQAAGATPPYTAQPISIQTGALLNPHHPPYRETEEEERTREGERRKENLLIFEEEEMQE